MTTAVISVSPDTPTSEVAGILRDHRISAVPVIDQIGTPIGMVSEGDLIGRDDADHEARRDWWLTLLAEGETLNPNFLASLRASKRRVRDVMTAPVVTVGEERAQARTPAHRSSYKTRAGTPRWSDCRHRQPRRSPPNSRGSVDDSRRCLVFCLCRDESSWALTRVWKSPPDLN